MEVKRVRITPEQAQDLLGLNTANRNLSKARVTELAEAIERGEWVEDGNPIRISSSGVLLDGQHRLAAIIKADMPVWAILATGLADEARLAIDTGMKRSFAHYLSIRGVPSSVNNAAVCNIAFLYSKHGASGLAGNRHSTHSQLWTFWEKNEQDIQAATRMADRVATHVRGARSVVALAYLVFTDVDPGDAGDFFAKLTFDKMNPESPIATLIRTLNDPGNERWLRGGGTASRQRLFAFYVKAWNAYRDGAEMSLLRFSPGGRTREAFPVPR